MAGDEEDNFVDMSSEYSPKSDYSKPSVIQSQVMAINEKGSKPMIPGFTTHIKDKFGNVKPVIIPDARQEVCAAIEILKSNLFPEIRSNKEAKEITEEFEEYKEDIQKKYIYNEQVMGVDAKGFKILAYSGKQWMPNIGELILTGISSSRGGAKQPMFTAGAWDGKVNAYWDEVLKLYLEFFGELNVLIDKLNYFKKQARF